MTEKNARASLGATISARFDGDGEATIEAWRRHLSETTPGLTFTSGHALRSLVGLAATLPEVKRALEGKSKRVP